MSNTIEIAANSCDDVDWILSENQIRQFLNGQLVFVPESLREEVESYHRFTSIYQKELVYLVWGMICNAPKPDNKSRYAYIHSDRFKEFGASLRDVNNVRTWLIERGFVIKHCKDNYKVNGYPKRYRAAKQRNPIPVELVKRSLKDGKAIGAERGDLCCQYTRECLSALKADENKLIQGVQQIIAAYKDRNLNKKKKKGTRLDRGIICPEQALFTLGKPLFSILNNSGRINRGDKGQRLFSPYTFLMREFRKLFFFSDQPMTIHDMRCCQPCFLGNISSDHRLVEDCINNQFYKFVESELRLENREDAKEAYCIYAYGEDHPSFPLSKAMMKRYPYAAKYMSDRKKGNYKKFSWEMQSLEAEIFIEGVYGRLCREGIPALSVHDGIACNQSDGGRVSKIIKEELAKKKIKGFVESELIK